MYDTFLVVTEFVSYESKANLRNKNGRNVAFLVQNWHQSADLVHKDMTTRDGEILLELRQESCQLFSTISRVCDLRGVCVVVMAISK